MAPILYMHAVRLCMMHAVMDMMDADGTNPIIHAVRVYRLRSLFKPLLTV